MNLLGIDYGEKKIGVAYSNDQLASGIATCSRNEAISYLSNLCQTYKVEKIIIGMPVGRLRSQVETFVHELKESLGITVVYWDETLSTNMAQRELFQLSGTRKRRRQKEHETAAAILLQTYIDEHKA